MAITQAMCTSFKIALLDGEMDFSANTTQVFKIALYTSSATLSAATTSYSATNEVSGTNYAAGGNTLTISANPTSTGTTAFLDFVDSTWANATITARGALIYSTSAGNPAVAVLDFGSDKTTTASAFTVQFPAGDSANAIIRIATQGTYMPSSVGLVGVVNVWGEVNDAQDPNWQGITISQSSNWNSIVSTQDPNWERIAA